MDFEPHEDQVETSDSSLRPSTITRDGSKHLNEDVPLFLGLGSDNFWYAFNATTVHNMFQAEVSDVFKESIRTILIDRLPTEFDAWRMLGKSGKSKLTHIWSLDGSSDTLSWSQKVPIDSGKHSAMVIMHSLQNVICSSYIPCLKVCFFLFTFDRCLKV